MKFEPQAKLLWHGDIVKEWVNTGRTSPILVEVAPTGYCNANCPWCFFSKQQSKQEILPQTMMQALVELAAGKVKAINWSGGGEPTLHKKFPLFVKYASLQGLKQGLFTNGLKEIPHQDKFEWIRISLTDQGFKKIVRPKVPFGICVNQIEAYGYQELRKFCCLAKQYGASYFQIRPALSEYYKNQVNLRVPSFLKEYENRDFKVYITDYKYRESTKPKTYKYCYGYHFCPSIDWKGNLSVCLYLGYKKEYVLGNLNKKAFKDIWKKIPKRKKVIDSCQNCCKNHEINKILYNVSNLESVDFL
ncbi:MAG: radical SAM protein [Candidatus Aceula meridiana]|nr:radical SAM protein [Candidatus Aceula meridiana]